MTLYETTRERHSVRAYQDKPLDTEVVKTLIDNWNNKVPPDGIVFHLGDFAVGRSAMLRRFLKRLNSKIILITGNHDNIKLYQDSDKVTVAPLVLKTRFQDMYRVTMCHYPFLCYAGEKMKSVWQLYGHIHSGGEDTRGMDIPRVRYTFPMQYDVGVDGNGLLCHSMS